MAALLETNGQNANNKANDKNKSREREIEGDRERREKEKQHTRTLELIELCKTVQNCAKCRQGDKIELNWEACIWYTRNGYCCCAGVGVAMSILLLPLLFSVVLAVVIVVCSLFSFTPLGPTLSHVLCPFKWIAHIKYDNFGPYFSYRVVIEKPIWIQIRTTYVLCIAHNHVHIHR